MCLGSKSVIGHGRRHRQAHDKTQDWIVIRRGICKACGKALTVLPKGCVPGQSTTYPSVSRRWNFSAKALRLNKSRLIATIRIASPIPQPSWVGFGAGWKVRPFLMRVPTLFARDWRATSQSCGPAPKTARCHRPAHRTGNRIQTFDGVRVRGDPYSGRGVKNLGQST